MTECLGLSLALTSTLAVKIELIFMPLFSHLLMELSMSNTKTTDTLLGIILVTFQGLAVAMTLLSLTTAALTKTVIRTLAIFTSRLLV